MGAYLSKFCSPVDLISLIVKSNLPSIFDAINQSEFKEALKYQPETILQEFLPFLK
jgi:hypothetical protein